jgi:hypothetical protein
MIRPGFLDESARNELTRLAATGLCRAVLPVAPTP